MSDDNKDNSEKKPRTPEWATAPFKRFLDQTERLDQVIHLSIRGISGLRGFPKLAEAIANLDKTQNAEDAKKRIAEAHRTADLAKREMDTGFPVLHSQAVVNLWSLLEALIQDFLCEWILNTPDALFVEEIKKLKVKIGEYEQLERRDRISYLIELLERDLVVGMKNGVHRFEAILAPFKLAGPIKASIRRDLLELGQVRNVIVHRAGIVDHKFVTACPWMKMKVGDSLQVTHKMFGRYFGAVHAYATLLIYRLGEYHGVDMKGSSKNEDENKSEKGAAA
jgi:hypothetical protein